MTIRNCYTSDKNISNKKNNRDWKTRYISFHFSLCFYYMLFPFIYIYHKWLILIVQKHDVIENNRQRTIDEQQTMIDRGIFMDCIHTLLTILSQESNFNSTSIRYLVIVLSINSPTNSFLDFLGKTVSLWRFSLNLCHSLVTKSAFLSFFIFFFMKISCYKVMFPGYSILEQATSLNFHVQLAKSRFAMVAMVNL